MHTMKGENEKYIRTDRIPLYHKLKCFCWTRWTARNAEDSLELHQKRENSEVRSLSGHVSLNKKSHYRAGTFTFKQVAEFR